MSARARAARPAAPDMLVLRTRPLRPGTDLQATARFDQDAWDLTPALHQQHQRTLTLHFAKVPSRYRQAAKDLIHAMLTGALPPGEGPKAVGSLRAILSDVRAFLVWAEKHTTRTLNELTAADLEGYHQHVDTLPVAAGTKAIKRRAARLLWTYRAYLPTDHLTLDPARAPRATVHADTARENTTARIPEQVHAPLLAWALCWVEQFADDILAALAEWAQLSRDSTASRQRRKDQLGRTNDAAARLTRVLEDYRAEKRALPGSPGGAINRSHLARLVGCGRRTLYNRPLTDWIEHAGTQLGVADGCYLRTDLRGRVDGAPWLPALAYEQVPHLAQLLQTACYITIAFLSGMRDGEVKHLRRGAVSRQVGPDDRPIRRTVTSQAFKGETDPHGVIARWVVTAPVEHAVTVLERLQLPEQDYLFAQLPYTRPSRHDQHAQVRTTLSTNNDLAAFTTWINAYQAEHGRGQPIPAVDGRPWTLSTGQFRRTLAWFIARRPGGTIAGALQYRHHSVQMFEGYAGTSDSGFRAEVDAEQALARGEALGDLFADTTPLRLTGPAAARGEQRLTALAVHADFPGTVVTDRKRLARLMARHDPHIYPGQFITCVYNPDQALCRRQRTDQPALDHCEPLHCRNVALTNANLHALTRHLADLDTALTHEPLLAPYVRQRLSDQRDQVRAFLTRHTPQEPTS